MADFHLDFAGPATRFVAQLTKAAVEANDEAQLAAAAFGKFGKLPTLTANFDTLAEDGEYYGVGAVGAPHPSAHCSLRHIQLPDGRGLQLSQYPVVNEGITQARVAHRYRLEDGSVTAWERLANFADVPVVGRFGKLPTLTTNFDTLAEDGEYYGVGSTGAPHPTAYCYVKHTQLPEGRGVQIGQWGVVVGGAMQARLAHRYRSADGSVTAWVNLITSADLPSLGSFATQATATTDIDNIYVSGQFFSTSAAGLPSPGTFTAISHIQVGTQRAYQTFQWGETVSGVSYLREGTRFRDSAGVWGPIKRDDIMAGHPSQIWQAMTEGKMHTSAGKVMATPKRSQFYTMASNIIYNTAAELKGRYDQLVTDFPDYVSAAELGRDAWDNPIMQYTFAPPEMLGDFGGANPHPKICVSAGMHCGERPALVSMLCFADDLCRHWRGDEILTQLRWGCKLVIVPNWCPSGINPSSHSPTGHSRLNGNGVDINRNFDYNWASQTDPRKGSSAASELETQLIQGWADLHPDALIFLDQHSAESASDTDNEYPLWFITRSRTAPIVTSIARKQHAWMKREILLDEGNVPRVNISSSGAGWMTSYYNEVLERKAFTIEGGMPANPSIAHISFTSVAPLRLVYVKQMAFTLHEIWQWQSGQQGHVPIL